MNNEKLCEYLSDIGVLLFDNIDLFFQIHSNNQKKNFKNEQDNLKDSLYLYLQKTSKNDKLLHAMSKNLIESYYNSQAILKYKTLKNMVNIFQNKLFLIYHNFIINISKHIFKRNDDNRIKRTNSDDYIFRRSNDNSPVKKITKKPKSKPKRKVQRLKKTNQYKNNYYTNIQENNVNPHSFFVNTNDYYLNMYKNDLNIPYNANTNLSNNDSNNNDIYNNENIVSYKYYTPMVNIQSKKPINDYIPMDEISNEKNQFLMNDNINNDINNYYDNNENINNIPLEYKQIQRKDFVNDNIDYSMPDDYDFFENEKKHLQKVQNKIMNLKNEKITKLEEQCTFTPNINSKYKYNKNGNNINKTFERLYNDSSVSKLKKEENIKKYLEGFTFTPHIEINEKYRVKSTFQNRRIEYDKKKSEKKKQKENEEKRLREASKKRKVDEKEVIQRLYIKEFEKAKKKREEEKKIKEKEEKKKKVINWKQVYKKYYEKYPEGDDYKKQMEKRKKFFESINKNKDKDSNKNNNVIDFNDFLKEKENKKAINDEVVETNNNDKDIDQKDINDKIDNSNDNTVNNKNNNENLGNNEEHPNASSLEEAQEAINEAYKSSSLKNLLNNNNLSDYQI